MTTATPRRPSAYATTAGDIMERKIVTVSRTAPLSEVERVLAENRISGVPVTDQSGRAVGVISFRDLLDHYAEDPDSRPRRGPNYYKLPTEHMMDEEFDEMSVPPESEDTAGDAMTPEIIHVHADATVEEVAKLMVERSVHRILVNDPESKRIVGIVTSLGVLKAIAG